MPIDIEKHRKDADRWQQKRERIAEEVENFLRNKKEPYIRWRKLWIV
jgi:hypothetical protein